MAGNIGGFFFNFVYTGEKNGIDITLFENNHIYKTRPDRYEATLVYLIRRHGELTLDGVYDEYLLENGAYPMQVFIGKTLDKKE